MAWQDIAVSLSNLLFTYSLSQQAYYGFVRKKGLIVLQTSLLTLLGLFTLTISFISLGLYFSAVVTMINGVLWYILFLQRIIYEKA
ncbi:hypothetical protein HYX17_02685 [Candidatus Woesearchaeota archaeon]|nr:hypothetical protein [Candidatus Woesearchaeota archaeon]